MAIWPAWVLTKEGELQEKILNVKTKVGNRSKEVSSLNKELKRLRAGLSRIKVVEKEATDAELAIKYEVEQW